jgi:branched-chain amino acid transport system permease protein
MLGGYWESVAIFMGINCLMGISLYIPMTAGLISLGQGGFMAIGAYVCALLTKSDVPFALALAAGGAAAAIAGLIVGAPALRIRGIYVMILTLGFGEATSSRPAARPGWEASAPSRSCGRSWP